MMASRGRPRAFDRDEVLGRAMDAFWAHGYDGASIPVLTGAMGISAQSLYAAFKSKDALYREAVERYRATIGGFADRSLGGHADALDGITDLFAEAAALFSQGSGRPGCMVAAAPSGITDDPLAEFGRRLRTDGVDRLVERLRRGIADGQVTPDTDCVAWARYLSATLQGMSDQARDGASGDALRQVADIVVGSVAALRRLPD